MALKDLKKGDSVILSTKWAMSAKMFPRLIAVDMGVVDSVRPSGKDQHSVYTEKGERFDATIWETDARKVGEKAEVGSVELPWLPVYLRGVKQAKSEEIVQDARRGYELLTVLNRLEHIIDDIAKKGDGLTTGILRDILGKLVYIESVLDAIE